MQGSRFIFRGMAGLESTETTSEAGSVIILSCSAIQYSENVGFMMQRLPRGVASNMAALYLSSRATYISALCYIELMCLAPLILAETCTRDFPSQR